MFHDLGHLLQRNTAAFRRADRNVGNGIDIFAVLREKAHNHVEPPLAVQDLRHSLAADGGLNDTVHVVWQNSITGGAFAVHPDEKVGLAKLSDNAQVFDALNRSHHLCDSIGGGFQVLEIVSKQLDRVLTLDARHRLFDVVLDGLREVVIDAWNLTQFGLDLAHEFRLSRCRAAIGLAV